jgi:acyl carrier protein
LYLREKLPEYMVPSVLVEMESIPLTANGKADRKALPDPDATEVPADQYVAPRNDAEARLARIWQDVLEEEQVGVHDDFFELGGHSLLAVRLISAIRKEFTVEIPISHVFDYPTIALLAAELDQKPEAAVLPSIEVIRPRPEYIPLSFSQERLWFIDRMEGSVQYHVPAVLSLKGELILKPWHMLCEQ